MNCRKEVQLSKSFDTCESGRCPNERKRVAQKKSKKLLAVLGAVVVALGFAHPTAPSRSFASSIHRETLTFLNRAGILQTRELAREKRETEDKKNA